jgi:hypothetical protein
MKKSKKETEKDIQLRDKLQAEALLNNETYRQLIAEYEDLKLFGKKRNRIAKEEDHIMKLLPKKLPKTISTSSKYFYLIQRWRELDKEKDELEERWTTISKEIFSKFNLPLPYSLNELKIIAEGKAVFLEELNKIVDIIQLRPTQYKPIPPEQLTKEDLAFCPHHSEIVDDGYLDEEGFFHFKIKAGEPRYAIHYLLDILLKMHEPEKKKERFRTGYINPFEILYKVSGEGKNRLQIAKELSGINIKGENPAYNPELKAKYEQVKRATKTLKKIISKK